MTNKYTFSKIYGQETTQKEFFNGTMLGIVKNFIDGQNCLVFSYGVTSSGKTYTIQGEPRDAGILPRALDVLFNSINNKHLSGYILKPKMFMDVVKLTKEEAEEERRSKEKTLKLSNDEDPDVMSLLGDDASDASQLTNITTCSESSNASFLPNKESLDPSEALLAIESRVREETKVTVDDQGQILFSIWVSFAEIYNEQIFDLLVPISKKKNARRPVLRLSDDRNGSPYIKGLKEICVNNADEAYKLLTIGKRNLQTACTKLNHQSSRSHCIFNIKIIRVVDKANPRMARVSMLSLCDLAGSERSAKTQSVGDRLKEAGNINTSLMTLGRCIEMLRYNQSHKEHPKIIPFRDSKLTRLFQNFFCGQGRVNMIVNVNQCASMFDETQHVFKFSAIAKQVVITQKQDLKSRLLQSAKKTADLKKRAVSISWATPGQLRELNSAADQGASIPLPEGNEDEDLEEDDLNVEELLETIKDLQSKLLKERREKLQLELKIRDEVCSEMMKQLVEIEDECSERIRMNEEATEEMYEKRIQILMDAYENQGKKQSDFMTDKDDEWVSSILFYQEQMKNKEKDAEIERLRKKVNEAKIEQVLVTGKSNHESSDMGDSILLDTLTKQLEDVKSTLKEKDEEIKELNEMLTEAGETFQAKEKEIQDLKHLLEEDKANKAEQVAELEKALIESKKALEMADQKIKSRDETVETTRRTLQDEVDSLKSSLDSWKMKFEKEEEESLKREQALINGYKAEIANLKNQLSMVKAEHRHNSPCKSPAKHRKHQDHFMEDLSKQLKDLQEEFDKNSAATLELEEALHKTKQTNEELEVKLSKQSEENETAQAKIDELGRKCEELESRVLNLQSEKEEAVKKVEEVKENKEKTTASEEDIESLKSKVAEKDLEIAELKEQTNKLNVSMGRDLQFQLDEANIEISQLQSNCAKLERKAVNLEKLYKEKTKQNMELNDELNKMKVAKEMLEEDLQDQEETEEKMAEMSKENEELKQRVEELETELKQQQGNSEERFLNIQKENADLQEKMEKLKEDVTKEEHVSSALKSELESATTRLKNLEKICETQEKNEKMMKDMDDKIANCPQCQEWQKKYDEVEKTLETVKGEVNQLREELTSLRSDLKAKIVEISDLEEKCENVKCELAKRDQTFVETLEKLEQTKDQYDAFKQEMEILKENLEEKEGELERLQSAQADMMEQLNTTNGQVHELSDAKLKFAEMKSSLHMQKTLYEKTKAELVSLKEEKCNLISNEEKLKEQIKSLEQRTQCMERDGKELSGLKAELAEMKKNCTESEEKWKILQVEKTDIENKYKKLEYELSKVYSEREERDDECVQKVSKLETKLETTVKNNEELKDINSTLQEAKNDLSRKLENLSQELAKKNDVIDNKEEMLTDLQHRLKEAENSIERQNSITSELNDMKAKFQELEQIKTDLENKVTQASQASVQKNDVHNRKLIQELSDCHRKMEDLQEAKESLEEKVENLKSEIATLSKETKEDSCSICPTIHKELDLSHGREQTLKKQLQTAGENIGELNNKICDLEDQVSQLNQKIQEAEDKNVHQEPRLSMPGNSVDLDNLRDELTQKLDMIRELQGELVRKDSRLQTEKMKYKQLLEERSDEHRRYEAAMKDATANEECIAVLKTALAEQEETMEHQDTLIQQHEKNIEKSQKECEKYMNMYQSLLSTTNTSSVEIRDLSKKVCDLSVEIERVRSEKKDLENKISSLKKQEAEHQHLTQENLSLRETKSAVKDLKDKLSQVREEKESLQTTLKSVTTQVESLQQEKRILEDKLDKTQERDSMSDKKLEDMTARLSEVEVRYSKRENEFKALREQKGKLEAILKENNAEIKDLEKSLLETRAECEALKSDAKKEVRDQLSGIQKEHEAAMADMKVKIREKDHSLRNGSKQIRQLEDEVKELVEKNKDKDIQMKAWKEEKDKLVSSLSEIIEKQKEDKEKVKELEKEKSHLEALVRDQIETIKQLTSSGSSISSARRSRLRNTSVSSDVSNLDMSETPLRRTSTRRGRKRRSYSMPDIETPASKKKDSDVSLLSEDVGDERERIQIDATPPVAAKTLRRTRKKPRSSTDLLREEAKESSMSKAADKENKSMKKIGSLLSALKKSPVSKSAKKHLAEIKEMPSPNHNLGSSLVEVEDCGTQMSAEKVKEPSSRKKSRHALYKEPLQISEPLDCGQFIHTTPEENIHETVKKRLRGRPRK
ncbi:kinesin-like protein KIF20B [Saccostrea echinata]|uniref:kinesin-like protein KIF20B n=1 Tax=Saccostrea echinata TaxID=191078 RepID=UPI002A7EBBE3|nr:kinesin-like protein KIF20B [Saccostrea echinata]